MTKFSVISDVHLDHYAHSNCPDKEFLNSIIDFLNKEIDENDYLILAGDLCDGNFFFGNEFHSIMYRINNKEKIIYVPGNHDYWNALPFLVINMAKQFFGHVLDNESLILDNIKIFGGTLWFAKNKNTNPAEKNYWPDYVYCTDISQIFSKHNEFLEKVKTDKPDIIISHHVPLLTSVAPEFKNARNNDFFVTDLSSLVKAVKPKFWIHGHTHNPFNYDYKGTHVLCNPLGYPGERKNTLAPIRFEVIT